MILRNVKRYKANFLAELLATDSADLAKSKNSFFVTALRRLVEMGYNKQAAPWLSMVGSEQAWKRLTY